ncbi:hypothetical protein NDI76_13615 [Halogeometricum sp. S1BR25-6]|uniref:ATP synthase protein I n=1 Tax=Halogeometricum salsisoli TaxID=2950536 RepID=A0ABU2GG51_9EURY|nr:hypothetical protein [Halogeometricum sp. S1BR25-6]MDS0299782.1 hypothetical protein [Halogeometricum sp. S1BR25-6]
MPSNTTSGSRDFSPENRPVFNLLMAGLVTVSIGTGLYGTGDASPALAVAGFAATGVGLGPVSSSAFGRRVGEWFEAIGGAARVGVMLVVATGVVTATLALDVPVVWTQSALFGSMLALNCYVVYRIASHRLQR